MNFCDKNGFKNPRVLKGLLKSFKNKTLKPQ